MCGFFSISSLFTFQHTSVVDILSSQEREKVCARVCVLFYCSLLPTLVLITFHKCNSHFSFSFFISVLLICDIFFAHSHAHKRKRQHKIIDLVSKLTHPSIILLEFKLHIEQVCKNKRESIEMINT